MSVEKKHIDFTASDIERYHKGEMSPKQRHDLEKAALDDPFLADALQGYAAMNSDYSGDLAELRQRLSERTADRKVIPLAGGRRTSFPWFRAAAVLVLLAGAALIVNRFAFNNKQKEVATLEHKDPEKPGRKDTGSATAPVGSTGNGSDSIVPGSNGLNATIKSGNTETYFFSPSNNGSATATKIDSTRSDLVITATAPAERAAKPVTDSVKYKIADKEENKDLFAEAQTRQGVNEKAKRTNEGLTQDNVGAYRRVPAANNTRAQAPSGDNYFRGRVMDANNNPVPFANITNTRDNAGTYADAKGYFNFVSPDTVLDVQVKSIGFENNNVQLRNTVPTNQVIMQDDKKSLAEVIVSNKKPNTEARSRESNVTLEEPEPADGWENYDTYLANNLKLPEEIKTKELPAGEVEISFEVNKDGEPINIKIEKSLCAKCDEEAKRLIKEGPKWKRKAKKGRTTVKIPFSTF